MPTNNNMQLSYERTVAFAHRFLLVVYEAPNLSRGLINCKLKSPARWCLSNMTLLNFEASD